MRLGGEGDWTNFSNKYPPPISIVRICYYLSDELHGYKRKGLQITLTIRRAGEINIASSEKRSILPVHKIQANHCVFCTLSQERLH